MKNVKALARQPFDTEKVEKFFGSRKAARDFLLDLNNALLSSDKARDLGESDDTEFEMMFWNGTLYFDEDEHYELQGTFEDDEVDRFYLELEAYDEAFDATFFLGKQQVSGRPFVAVRYEFKELEYALSSWWLERE